ncbi:MAG: glycoside hydrolase family 99-like domain-containing protein [Patescibacteria group bacterium]|nr:glycoside hydrolase family 99-like domain-containing protein [Patescibacteria group bacterium]
MQSINRRNFLITAGQGAAGIMASDRLSNNPITQQSGEQLKPHKNYQIGVYYFPNYHVDPRNEAVHGRGWTEWELVKRGEPKYPGHRQPRKPLWGYEDESKPQVFEKKIHAAAEHGINHFIFDWYWYNDGPFLNRGLEEGYLYAKNNDRLQFSLMWANHDWIDIHPAKLNNPPKLFYPGAITGKTFNTMTDYIISRYFKHPSYWKIDGCPYFSIYELFRLIEGFGGIEKTKEALESFRNKTKLAGFPDLHLNAVLWGVKVLPTEQSIKNPNEILSALNFSSTTSYVWIHHVKLPEFPVTQYRYVAEKAVEHWNKTLQESILPYHPNVTMGWDSSPRTCQSDVYTNAGYPFMNIIGGNTPDEFKNALIKVKEFLTNQKSAVKIFNINAWNEWTEGSYLEPDTLYGMGYLQAIKEVFG